jgi:PHS family inorganic phosphate transporter-like MFS transporter
MVEKKHRGPDSVTTSNSVFQLLDNAAISWFHFKIVIISGMGFFTDAYDLFSISLLTKSIGRLYYQDNPFHIKGTVSPGKLPIGSDAAVSSVALVGTLTGQLFFGWLGDKLGRKACYGIVLSIMIFGAFAQSMSYGTTPNAVVGTLCFWRFLLGVGVGGDYPLSACIMSEYASKVTRGAFVGSVFAMQGIGILTAAAITAIVCACFQAAYPANDFPLTIPGCSGSWSTCTYEQQIAYWKLVQGSCPRQADFMW